MCCPTSFSRTPYQHCWRISVIIAVLKDQIKLYHIYPVSNLIKVIIIFNFRSGPEMSSYSQTFLHGEATVPDRYSWVQKGQWLSPRHHLQPTQRPQVVLVTHLHSHTVYILITGSPTLSGAIRQHLSLYTDIILCDFLFWSTGTSRCASDRNFTTQVCFPLLDMALTMAPWHLVMDARNPVENG